MPGETVLGAENGDEMHAGGVGKKFDRAAALRVDAGVIGDEADVLAAERSELLRFEDIDAGLHAAGAAGMFFGGVTRGAENRSEGDAKYCARYARGLAMKLEGTQDAEHITAMIFWKLARAGAL